MKKNCTLYCTSFVVYRRNMGTYALMMGIIDPSKEYQGKYVTLDLDVSTKGKVSAILTPAIARDVVEQEVKIALSDATAPQVGPLLDVITIVLRQVGWDDRGDAVVIKGVTKAHLQKPEYFKDWYETNGCWVSFHAKGQERRLDVSLGTAVVGPVLFVWTKDMGIYARIIGEEYAPPIMDAASYAFPHGLSKNQLSVFNVALKMMIDPKFALSGRMTLQTMDSDRTTRKGLVQLAHNEMMYVISKHRKLTERDSTMLIEKYSRLCHYLRLGDE